MAEGKIKVARGQHVEQARQNQTKEKKTWNVQKTPTAIDAPSACGSVIVHETRCSARIRGARCCSIMDELGHGGGRSRLACCSA